MIEALNTDAPERLLEQLEGLYEHSPWIVERALAKRPFKSLSAFKYAMAQAVSEASELEQLELIRAHPELGGKAAVAQTLTPASNAEQSSVGLTQRTESELGQLAQLNAAYKAKFGWPFVLAVRGPRGSGLSPAEIFRTFKRRLAGTHSFERAECLRNIHRIAELRLDELANSSPTLGRSLWDWHQTLAQHSDPEYSALGQLTVTYLTQAHQNCQRDIAHWMREAGCDSVTIDAVGNVVGRYEAASPGAKTLLTGSHFDTVRNAGKYDGRLGILLPVMCIAELHDTRRRLPFALEVVAFAEEEGQRYKATFLGSGALTGNFDPAWLDQLDAAGIAMREAMQSAGLSADLEDITSIKRNAADYLGFVEVHIEQGPVLNAANLPLGVVTSVNGSLRYLVELNGTACHAGATPMDARSDAALAAAEIALYTEQRALLAPGCVGTVGMLEVPGGSINVVPGRCQLSLDLRAPTDALRDALATDVRAQLEQICVRRGVSFSLDETLNASAAPSDEVLMARWALALELEGTPHRHLASGAGHDAMMLHRVMPQAMLFVRGENAGISHNPLESTNASDMQLALNAFMRFLKLTALP